MLQGTIKEWGDGGGVQQHFINFPQPWGSGGLFKLHGVWGGGFPALLRLGWRVYRLGLRVRVQAVRFRL